MVVAVGSDRSAVCRCEAGDRLPSLGHLVLLGRVRGRDAQPFLPEDPPGFDELTDPREGGRVVS